MPPGGWLLWFRRASPSTTLDKLYSELKGTARSLSIAIRPAQSALGCGRMLPHSKASGSDFGTAPHAPGAHPMTHEFVCGLGHSRLRPSDWASAPPARGAQVVPIEVIGIGIGIESWVLSPIAIPIPMPAPIVATLVLISKQRIDKSVVGVNNFMCISVNIFGS